MNKDDKLEKVCKDFSTLKEDQQDYILGILQALVFAKSSNNQSEIEARSSLKGENSPLDSLKR
ncbi:MAG: hypothetical protein FWB86_06775 [Treponema sp.]|nr:hypothetical protein [Treponema sp.]MCL2250501.1 hypothetical protein [Treponema sp.]